MTTYEKIVKGATKLKLAAPKTKYIEPILIVTHSARDIHDEDFRLIMKSLATRLQDTAWTVVYKSLLVLHIMIREGEGDLSLEYLSHHYKMLECRNVSRVASGVDNKALKSYSKYLMARAKEFAQTEVDYVRDERLHNAASKNPESGGRLRRLSVDKGILREVESVQRQIDFLLHCKFQESEVNNDVILTGFRMLVHDLLSLYQSLNEGVINLLEHYFEMSKPDAERALDIYKVFVDQTKDVVAYLRIAKRLEYATKLHVPTIKHAPTALASSLEEYLTDPSFDLNRKQFLAEKDAKHKGGSSANLVREAASQPAASGVQFAVQQAVQQPVQSQFTATPQQQGAIVFQTQPTGYNPFMTAPAAAQAPVDQQQPQQQQIQAFQNNSSAQPSVPQQTNFMNAQQTGNNTNMIPVQKTGITFQASNLVPLNSTNPGVQSPNQTQQANVQQAQQQPQQQPPLAQASTGFFSQRPNSTIMPSFTGVGFGGYSQQAVQPQGTGNPFLNNNNSQMPTNNGFAKANTTAGFTAAHTGMLQAQPQPQQQQQQPLQAQYTSTQTTLKRSKTNPFALGNIPENGAEPTGKQSDPTTNPFSSTVQSQAPKPLQNMYTGTNPFKETTAPLRPQATAGGLEKLPTVPVFPETQKEFQEQQAQLRARFELEQQKLALQHQQQQQTGMQNFQTTGQFPQQQTGFFQQPTMFSQQSNGGFSPQQPMPTGNPFMQPQQPQPQPQQQQYNGNAYNGPSLI